MLKRLYKKFFKTKRVLFYRDVLAYYGGHQKVADYFEHLESSSSYQPEINFSAQTRWDTCNPWFPKYQNKCVEFNPSNYDFIFLAGTDWKQYLPFSNRVDKPVINFIQHLRHADPSSDVFKFLSQPAVRICVSHQVADAIKATGKTKGPIFTIPNGVDLPLLIKDKVYDLIILGIKQPDIAKTIQKRLATSGLRLLVVDQWIPREEWFGLMAASRLALLLPNATEGFYLPALEAMKYCDLVIVPDCVGNRGFCRSNKNCLMPEYNIDSIVMCVDQGLQILKNEQILAAFKQEMLQTLKLHTLTSERKAFLRIMDDVQNLWIKNSL